jgi:WD40 repeat protein
MAPPCRRLIPPLALLLLAVAARAEPPARADAQGDPLPAGALARLGTTRFRSGNFIQSVAVAPDGKTLAVADNQGARILDLATGKELRALKTTGYTGFTHVSFSPDGKVFAAAEHDGRIRFWDPATGDLIGQVAPPTDATRRRPGSAFSFSGDGKYVAVGCADFPAAPNQPARAWVYEVPGGKEVAQVETLHNSNVRGFLSGDGKVLATTGHYMNRGNEPREKQAEINQTVQLWDVTTGKELRKVRTEGSWGGLAGAAFSPDGKQMALALSTGGFVVIDVAGGKELRHVAGRRNSGASLAYSPDGKVLAAAALDGTVQTWDAATGQRLGLYDVPRNPTGRAGFTADGKLLAWGSNGQSVYAWDVRAEKWLTPTGGHQTAVGTVAFTPDGRGIVSVSSDGAALFWDAAGKERRRVQLHGGDGSPFPVGAFMRFNGVVLSPDGKYALASSGSGVSLFELGKGREVCTFSGGYPGIGPAGAFSPDGSLVVTGNMDFQARKPLVRLYDVATGQELHKLEGHTGDLRGMAFAPDGKAVASASTNFQPTQTYELRLWEASGGKSLWRAERPQAWVVGLAFAPDAKAVAVLEQTGAVALHETTGGRELRRLGTAGSIGNPSAIAFSPDGRLLAVAGQDFPARQTRVRLYEVASGTVRHEFTGHDGPVSALAFSADDRRLATGGNDTTVLLWDLTRAADAEALNGKPGAEELDKLWAGLNDADARAAFRAMRRLQAAPEEAVALLAKNVQPAGGGADANAIAKLIAALDADSFDEREKASRELAALGKAAEAPLKKALADKPSAEAKQRIGQLLEKLKDQGPALEVVRPLRAVEVLERLGTPEAKKVLEALAKGQAEAPLTVAAKEALGRLGRTAKP